MEKKLKLAVIGIIFLSLFISCSSKKGLIAEEGEIKDEVIEEKYSLLEVWNVSTGLKTPESVLFDPATELIYVANINGKATEKDGNGFISKLKKGGEIVELEWVTGLNAPKGMAIKEDFLYVSDIDELVEISLSTGKVNKKYKREEAQFLNDVEVDDTGRVFVTDTRTANLYVLANGEFDIWSNLKDIERPNGLFHDGKNLYVGSKEAVSKIGANKILEKYCAAPAGVDGLKATNKGMFVVSDWVGHIHLVKPGEEPILLLDTSNEKINAADHEYISSEGLLLVPTFGNDRVVAYRLSM